MVYYTFLKNFFLLILFNLLIPIVNIEKGENLFIQNCSVCHIGGSNVIISEKNLKQETLKENEQYIWVKQIYWKLNDISCILVKRNKKWFQDMIPIISNFWDIIKREKIDGFEHRKPKSRITI
jgi:hypothetical protein